MTPLLGNPRPDVDEATGPPLPGLKWLDPQGTAAWLRELGVYDRVHGWRRSDDRQLRALADRLLRWNAGHSRASERILDRMLLELGRSLHEVPSRLYLTNGASSNGQPRKTKTAPLNADLEKLRKDHSEEFVEAWHRENRPKAEAEVARLRASGKGDHDFDTENGARDWMMARAAEISPPPETVERPGDDASKEDWHKFMTARLKGAEVAEPAQTEEEVA